jgi:L,D-peptidoglycan transpeptidase YkuD (ErfK/YbiS/YcfS/YnhG family)
MLIARVAVVGALLCGVAYGAVSAAQAPGGDVATVGAKARRDVPFDSDAVCDATTITALSARHPDVRQFVVMQTANFSASSGTVEVAVRTDDGVWRCQRGPQPAKFGRAGTRPLLERRSGDDTTPAGVFPLGVVTAWDGQTFSIFGNQPDPGTLARYRAVRYEDCWGATTNTARYQHLVNLPDCTGPDEWLRKIGDVYAHAAVIGANVDPISGDAPGETPYAAAIFLHRHSYSASGAPQGTSGCVSLTIEDLVDTIRLLDPRLSPHFAIGPTSWLRSSA